MGCSKCSYKRENYSNIGFHQKQEKSQVKNVIYHLKELGKKEQTNPKVAEGKYISKIREINRTF